MKLVAIIMFGAINTMGNSYGNYGYDTPSPTTPQKYTPYPTASRKYNTPDPTTQIYTPEPTQPKYTPEPTQPKYTPEPTQPKYTPEPTVPKYTSKPTQPKYTAEPTQPKYTSKPTQPKYTADPTKQLLIPPKMCYTKYDNPCTAENTKLYGFYFPSCISCCNFIQCDEFGRAFERSCGVGTSWDQEAPHACVHNTGQCKDECSNDNYQPKYTTKPVNKYEPQTTKTNSYIPPKIDTDKCYDDTKYNSPCNAEQRASDIYYFKSCDSCCNYIQCDASGQAFKRSCGVSTSWDQVALTCNHNDGQCGEKCGVPPVDKCYDLKKKYDNPCTEENAEKGHFFFKSCSSCCDYIQCDESGEAFPMSCGKGTYWNQRVKTCKHDYGQCNQECGNDGGYVPVYKKY